MLWRKRKEELDKLDEALLAWRESQAQLAELAVTVAEGVERITSKIVELCEGLVVRLEDIERRPTLYDKCKKCSSPLVDGLCSDETCPYSDRPQGATYTEE